jgi:hypothetical protein
MERFLKRIDAIDQQFREAKAVQEGEVERSFNRAANGSGC